MLTALLLALQTAPADPRVNPEWDADWPRAEAWCLAEHVQLTSADDFLKAGESYFSPDGRMVIFQGAPRPGPGENADQHYGMYVAPVIRDEQGAIVGLGKHTLLSEPGSANTCGWFHPTDFVPGESYTVLFGTTTTPPDEEAASGYQRGTSRYTWQFPNEMEIVVKRISAAALWLGEADGSGRISRGTMQTVATPLWTRDGYDAEASWSPDGRHIIYTRLLPGSADGDLWIYDTATKTHTELVAEEGYDGGPFFSPDGRRICYRSDRRGDNLLQVFVADLAFDAEGRVTGIERETAITDNDHVNWAPFFTPDGSVLFYATSEVSHANYEVFATTATGDRAPDERPRVRITEARGFDGLPTFTPDGSWMMWTAQRGPTLGGEARPSSQLWAARIDLDAVRDRLAERQREIDERALEDGFEAFTPGG